jgi:hypothetical protein
VNLTADYIEIHPTKRVDAAIPVFDPSELQQWARG